MKSSFDVQSYLGEHGIAGEVLHLSKEIPTVEAAARAVGTRPEQIVKSILFLVVDQPILAIACGTDLIQRSAIARVYGLGRKKVRLASAEEVAQICGYAAGALPPFAHLKALPTLIDRRVLEQQVVYAGGGDRFALLRLSSQALLLATGGQILDLIAREGS